MRPVRCRASILLLAALALACGSAPEQGGPEADFSRRAREALRTRDLRAISELYCWDGIDAEARVEEERRNLILLKGRVKEVTFVELPPGFQPEVELGGIRYRPNVPIKGRVRLLFEEISASDAVGGVTVPYSDVGGRYCLSVNLRSRPGVVGQRALGIGVRLPEGQAVDYTVECSYVVTGVLRDLQLRGNAPRHEVVQGEFVQACRARKRSAGGWVELTIEEEGQPVFQARTETGEAITYPSR